MNSEKMEVLKNISKWIDGNIGASSEAIFFYMVNGQNPRPFDAPSDAGDRGRCVVLLTAFPEWVERLKEIQELKIKGMRNREEVYPWNEQIPLILSMIHNKK